MGKKITTEDFIKSAEEKHGDLYDYSLVNYVNSQTKVKIICKEHGVFEQTPNAHKSGKGCSSCVGYNKTRKQVIKEFKNIHGNLYDYSKLIYLGSKIKLHIICSNHGSFYQTYGDHKRGYGCPTCGIEKSKKSKYKNKADILKKFNEVHGDKYDYSLVNYVNSSTKVKIICPEHGIFEQKPSNHQQGNSCPSCSMLKRGKSRKKSKDDIIRDFKSIHGDKYDYSLVNYVNSSTKVKIICKTHGVFEQTPNGHKAGKNCFKCSNNYIPSIQDIISEVKKIHNNKYDYSLVHYINANTKVKIICNEHGVFEQTVNGHKSGYGCPKCSGNYRFSTSEIIEEFKMVHFDKYDYSLVEYINAHTKVKIICPEHGVFKQVPNSHKIGAGCSKCSGLNVPTTKEWISSLSKEKLEKYDYSFVNYINGTTKIKIICPEHGPFLQEPSNHKHGQGCPNCANSGFKMNLPAILYYIRINKDGQEAYKIGITNRDTIKRYSAKDMNNITIIKEWYYENGQESYDMEQQIIKEFKYAKYNGIDLLDGARTKEMFKYDVLNLDIDNNLYY